MTRRPDPVRWAAPGGLRSLVEDLAGGLDVVDATSVSGVQRSGAALAGRRPPGLRRRAGHAGPSGPPTARARTSGPTSRRPPPSSRCSPWSPPGRSGAGTSTDCSSTTIRRWPGWPTTADAAVTAPRCWSPTPPRRTPPTAPGRPAAAGPELSRALQELLGAPEPASTHVHRWTFARPAGGRPEPYALTDGGLGLCGDGWAEKPRVEAAYLSGRALAEALLAR